MTTSKRSRRRQSTNGVCTLKVTFREESSTRFGDLTLHETTSGEGGDASCRAAILAAYEKILESHSTPLNRASALPFSKEAIREAIREELAENPENELRNHLEMAFVQLESFVPPDEYQLVEDFKQLSCAAQKMARSGDPKDVMESWKLVKQISGDQAVRIFENISEKMRRRLKEIRSIGLRSQMR